MSASSFPWKFVNGEIFMLSNRFWLRSSGSTAKLTNKNHNNNMSMFLNNFFQAGEFLLSGKQGNILEISFPSFQVILKSTHFAFFFSKIEALRFDCAEPEVIFWRQVFFCFECYTMLHFVFVLVSLCDKFLCVFKGKWGV